MAELQYASDLFFLRTEIQDDFKYARLEIEVFQYARLVIFFSEERNTGGL